MDKKYIYSFVLLLLASGCSSTAFNGSEPLAAANISTHTTQLVEKTAIDLTVDLIHPLTNEIIHTFNRNRELSDEDFEQNVKEMAHQLAEQLDQPMKPVKLLNGELTDGENRIILNEEKLINSIKNLHALDKTISLPLEIYEPNVTREAIQGIDEVVLGSYKTTFNARVTGRTENIALSANEINQIVLGPGDRFYFNLVVGERTREKGYQEALEIVNKQFVMGIGGGICQTSSTLYNAVLNAGLEILEVNSHSKSVGYVPAGKDATVSWGGPDFKFKNNKEYPVMIRTIVNKESGSIEVQVLASKAAVKV